MKKRAFDKEYKIQAVELCLEGDKSIAQVAKELGLAYNTLHRWVKEYKESNGKSFVGSGHIKPQNQEIIELRRRNQELEEELAILKKGARHLHQKPEVIYAFIFQHRNEFRVVKMCQVLSVSRSGYYDWLKRAKSKQKERKEQLTQPIRNEYLKSRKIYGSPKITQELHKQRIRVSQKTVARIMSEEGLRSITVRKFKATTNSNHPYNVYDNLLKQNFQATAPNEVWMADITYIPTDEGWLYLASIMDLYTRKIVGWYIDTRMTKELVIKALQRAFNNEKPTGRVLHHSDRGSQYASNDYQQLLQEHHFQVSMSRRGNCYDNACIESFHSLIKKECIYLNRFRTRKEAKQAIFEYIECFYNRKRSHSALGYVSPCEFEAAYYANQRKVAA